MRGACCSLFFMLLGPAACLLYAACAAGWMLAQVLPASADMLLVGLHLPQAMGIAEGTIGTIATVIGGILGVGVLAYLATNI
jgi:hypothetical protein